MCGTRLVPIWFPFEKIVSKVKYKIMNNINLLGYHMSGDIHMRRTIKITLCASYLHWFNDKCVLLKLKLYYQEFLTDVTLWIVQRVAWRVGCLFQTSHVQIGFYGRSSTSLLAQRRYCSLRRRTASRIMTRSLCLILSECSFDLAFTNVCSLQCESKEQPTLSAMPWSNIVQL